MRSAERLAVAFLIGLAMLDALAWVFVVPLFQSPDEPAHADYAFWIAHHHRLPVAADRGNVAFSDPQLRYLVAAVQTSRIAFHTEEKAAPGYGTAAYWRRIDAAAPPVPSRLDDDNSRPRLSYLYPFGYYLVAGIWVGLWQLVLPTLSDLYFSLRILNVLMLGATLTLAFGIFRMLRIPFWRSAALLAIVGLFPLTSFVSAYCQPDNLALMLSTAAIFLCLQLKGRDDLRVVALLGCVLGYLCVTKVQFGIVVGLGVFAAYFSRVPAWQLRSRSTFARALLLTTPSVVTSLVSRPIMANAPKGTTFDTDGFAAAIGRGFGPFLSFAGDAAGRGFVDFFGLGGASFTSFWGTFGWMDTPLVIGNEVFEGRVLDVLEFGTAAVMTAAVLVVAALTVRAVRVAANGHASLAVRAYFSNPALTAYVAFVVVMFALFVYTDGGFFPQGRNWLPLIVPSVLIAVDFAPKVFARSSLERWASNALVAGLLSYSLVGAVFAMKSIYDRYYVTPPMLPALEVPTSATVEGRAVFDGVTARGDDTEGRVFRRSSEIRVHGWAYDPQVNAPAGGVFVVVDGARKIPAIYGLPRPDVARAMGVGGDDTGYEAIVPTANLRPGPHRLAIVILAANKAYYESTPASVNISIRP